MYVLNLRTHVTIPTTCWSRELAKTITDRSEQSPNTTRIQNGSIASQILPFNFCRPKSTTSTAIVQTAQTNLAPQHVHTCLPYQTIRLYSRSTTSTRLPPYQDTTARIKATYRHTSAIHSSMMECAIIHSAAMDQMNGSM